MHVAISAAKARLSDLVHRAEAGDEVVLTRHGRRVARIISDKRELSREEKEALLDEIIAHGRANPSPGPCAARSADFLYGDDGMPG